MLLKQYLHTTNKSRIPAEKDTSVCLGLAVHLGPSIVFFLLLTIQELSPVEKITTFFFVSFVNLFIILILERYKPDIHLPTVTLKEWSTGLSLVFFKGFFCGAVVVTSLWWLLSFFTPNIQHHSSTILIIVTVMLTDFSYYWIHRLLNHGSSKNPVSCWFRRMHIVHHSTRVLDFIRGNVSSFFDTAVTGFQIPLAVIATILGLDLSTTLSSYALVLLLQATHHANFTFNIGYLRFLFMDNHAHKMHHCPRGYLVNHGALFSIWDQAFGTFYENWNLSPGYMQRNHYALPINKIK